jgi:isoaspartyl peptidase/L-asparaginase-like protein (Ntn-hydrolase superfamily)
VALDSFGSLASATSTGGIIGKMPGRVADSAIIGAGTYADNRSCAVSCTGMGDEFIRNCVAYQIHARMLWLKESLTQASRHALASIAANGAHGGLISLNTLGHCVMEFGTTAMFRAYANEENVFHVGIFREDCPTVI